MFNKTLHITQISIRIISPLYNQTWYGTQAGLVMRVHESKNIIFAPLTPVLP